MSGQKRIASHFPHFFQSEDTSNLFYRFLEVFGGELDEAENRLIQVMRAHWVDTADNIGSRGFDTASKGDLDKIFALYIENLGGTSLLKQTNRREGEEGLLDDANYRERIKGIVQVLLGGASNRNGLREIIAANLGVYGDSPAAQTARELIEIIEYLPTEFTSLYTVELFEEVVVVNPNPGPTSTSIKVTVLKLPPGFNLLNVRVTDVTTGLTVELVENPNGPIPGGTTFEITTDGTAIQNGTTPISLSPATFLPVLPAGASVWRVEAVVGQYYESTYDPGNHTFDTAVFGPDMPIFHLEFSFVKFQPATFMVRIPWDLPVYGPVLDALPEKPRYMIPFIVNKVKAAGVLGVVAYRKDFRESHTIVDELRIEEQDFSFQEQQPMQDQMLIGGVFDVARYDQSVFI